MKALDDENSILATLLAEQMLNAPIRKVVRVIDRPSCRHPLRPSLSVTPRNGPKTDRKKCGSVHPAGERTRRRLDPNQITQAMDGSTVEQ